MMQQIVSALKKLGRWIRHTPPEIPKEKPVPEKPTPLKGDKVFNEYLVVEYHNQKISLHKSQVPIWNAMSRKEKRIMADKFKKQIDNGKIRFELINNKWICLKNRDYEAKSNNKKKTNP